MEPSERPRSPRRPANAPARRPIRLDLRRGDPERAADVVQRLLAESGLTPDERVEVLGGALVVEALRPYWTGALSAEEAHDALRAADPELADAIEGLAPMLLGHAEVRAEAAAAIEAIGALLRSR